MYWNTEGEMVCGVMKLDYDNMRVAALFDGRRKLMNAPGLGYAVILSRLDKKGRGLKEKGRYYHVALAADGLPVYYHEDPEDEAAMNPLLYGKLRDSEKKAALAEEKDVNRHSGPGGKPGGAWWNPPGSVIPENSSCLFATGILLFWRAFVNVLLRSAALAYFRIFQSFRKADYLFLPGNFFRTIRNN